MFKFVTVVLFVVVLFSMNSQVFAGAPYDTVSIHDVQYVPDPATDQASPFVGDTIVVRGMVMHSPRDLYVGARWACYVVDPDSLDKPWSGFFLIQNDSFAVATNFGFVEPGMIIYATGILDEYFGFSELALLTNPVVPIDIESAGNALPDPKVLTAKDLDGAANGEKWESMLVTLNNASVVNNQLSSNQASLTDESGGTSYLDDYFMWFRGAFDANTYDWPPAGTNLNVTGYTRDVGPGRYTINPENDSFLEILTNPPVISGQSRNPGVPVSSDDVTVSATIVDNVGVDNAAVQYSVNGGSFQTVAMTADADTFSAVLPPQNDGSVVRYFIYAIDGDGDWTTNPGDTSANMYTYVIRDGGLSIMDIQYPNGYGEASPFAGYDVTVEGVVTTDSLDFTNQYYIQEKDSAWSGIWVYDTAHKFAKGDWVKVSGRVEERYNVTRVTAITEALVTDTDVAFAPVEVTTGEINASGGMGEAYESVLLSFKNVVVSNPFADGASNFGEFEINDGSGAVRIDDYSNAFRGNLDTTFALNDQIDEVIAIGNFSFSNYKIFPRNDDDIIGHQPVAAIGDDLSALPNQFALGQNYPNPFNPITNIEYQIAKPGDYTLSIYNILGQRVRMLVNGFHNAGVHQLAWNGLDSHNNQVNTGIYFYVLRGEDVNMTKKMIMIK